VVKHTKVRRLPLGRNAQDRTEKLEVGDEPVLIQIDDGHKLLHEPVVEVVMFDIHMIPWLRGIIDAMSTIPIVVVLCMGNPVVFTLHSRVYHRN